MSMFSRSSKGSHYKNGNYGSNYYQKKGFLGNLFDIIGSGGNSGHHNNQCPQQNLQNYQQQYPNQHSQNQQPQYPNTLLCSKCNSQIPRGSKFCLECGQKVNDVVICENCKEKQPPNAKFCLNCGTKVNE